MISCTQTCPSDVECRVEILPAPSICTNNVQTAIFLGSGPFFRQIRHPHCRLRSDMASCFHRLVPVACNRQASLRGYPKKEKKNKKSENFWLCIVVHNYRIVSVSSCVI